MGTAKEHKPCPSSGCTSQQVNKRHPLLPEPSPLPSIFRQWGLTKCWRSGPPGVTHSQLASQLHTKTCQVLQESSQGHMGVGCASTAHLCCWWTLPPAAARDLFLGLCPGSLGMLRGAAEDPELVCILQAENARISLLQVSRWMFPFALLSFSGLGNWLSSGAGQSGCVQAGMGDQVLYATARLVAGTCPPAHGSISL